MTPGAVRLVLGVVAGLAVGLVLLWSAVLVAALALGADRATLRAAARLVPDTLVLVRRLSADRSLGRGVRWRLLALLAYLAFPLDLVPDVLPVIGYADDAVVIALVLRSVVRRVGAEAVRSRWPGSTDGLRLLARLCRVPALAA